MRKLIAITIVTLSLVGGLYASSSACKSTKADCPMGCCPCDMPCCK